MNNEVCERLIYNLEHAVIKHDQNIWLSDHTTIFVVSEENRWSCATSGCAAGFTFLQEAPDGSLFDADTQFVLPNAALHAAFRSWMRENPDSSRKANPFGAVVIDEWAAGVLGLAGLDQICFIFYNAEDTEGVIARLRFLMANPDSEDPEEEFDSYA